MISSKDFWPGTTFSLTIIRQQNALKEYGTREAGYYACRVLSHFLRSTLHGTVPRSVVGIDRRSSSAGGASRACRRSNLGHCGRDQNAAETASHAFGDARQVCASNALLPEMDSRRARTLWTHRKSHGPQIRGGRADQSVAACFAG